MTDPMLAWLDATAIRRMVNSNLQHMASALSGQEMLYMLHNIHKATEVFPWNIVVRDVIRRDT